MTDCIIKHFRPEFGEKILLPLFFTSFLMRVAKSAFDYTFLNTDKRFNEASMANTFRMALNVSVPRKRPREPLPATMAKHKLKKVKVVLRRVDAPATGTPTAPAAREGSATGVQVGERDGASETATSMGQKDMDISTDSSKTYLPAKETSDVSVEEKGASTPINTSPASSLESFARQPDADTSKSKRDSNSPRNKSPGKQQSNYERLLDFAMTGGGTINEIIAALNQMLATYLMGRRKTKAVRCNCDKVNELIIVLHKTPPTEAWREHLIKYKDVLERM